MNNQFKPQPFHYVDKDYDEVSLQENQIYSEEWHNEVREIDKHEIIVKICEAMGTCPSNLSRAENLFEQIKFDIARYVIHHEYSMESSVRSKLLLWLESKTNPESVQKLNSFVQEYLK